MSAAAERLTAPPSGHKISSPNGAGNSSATATSVSIDSSGSDRSESILKY
jgi:hypothetical protein